MKSDVVAEHQCIRRAREGVSERMLLQERFAWQYIHTCTVFAGVDSDPVWAMLY